MSNEEKIEHVIRGIQILLTDKLLNQVDIDWEKDATVGSYLITTHWQTASRTIQVERRRSHPASFLDYFKQWIPKMRPRYVDLEIHIVHQCPHRMVLEQDPHLNWLIGKAND